MPWRTPERSSSEEKSFNEPDVASTTTSNEDVTHYHAYTQASPANKKQNTKPSTQTQSNETRQTKPFVGT